MLRVIRVRYSSGLPKRIRPTKEQLITEYGDYRDFTNISTNSDFNKLRETGFLTRPRVIPESSSNPILSKGDIQLLVERISNKWQITFFKCAVLFIFCASSGVVFYWKFYGERDKQKLSETASQIGKGALSDQELIDQANKITHNIVHGILNDPYINAEVTRLLSNVVQSDQVKSSSILLVNNLLAAESIQESIGKLLYDKLIQAINHPTVQDNLAHLVIQVLNRDDVKMNVSKLTSDVFTSEQIITTVQKVLGDAVVSEYVKVCSIQLGRETTNAILNDSIVRKNLSDALYSSITPTFFKKRAAPTVVAKTIEPVDHTRPSQPTSKDSQVQNQSSKSNPKRPDTDNDKIEEENKQITSIEDSLPIY